MKKEEIQIIGQKIINAEREIALGKNVKSNEDKIESYMKNLSPWDLFVITLYVENHLDNQEIF